MDEKDFPQNLEDCHKLIKQLLDITQSLIVRIEKLEEENKSLKERLNNNSSNSSQPPSTDRKKKKKETGSKNKGGGKVGHKGHFRKLLSSDEVDDIVKCRLPSHCECGGRINLKEDHHRHQVYELPKISLHITEYHLEKGRCSCCDANHIAVLPEGITWGITGPHLTSFMSQMVSKYKLSRRELQEFLKEQYRFTISLGSVFNKQKLVNKALEKPISALLNQIKKSPCVNMDETGHRRDGKSEWFWGMMSPLSLFFRLKNHEEKR